MNFKINICLLSVLLISSCNISNSEFNVNNLKSFNFIDSDPGSLILYIGNTSHIYTSSNKESSIVKWSSDTTNNIFVTRNGKISETVGYEYNIQIVDLKFLDTFSKVIEGGSYSLDYSVRLTNPDSGFLPATSVFTFIGKVNAISDTKSDSFKLALIKENFYIDSIRWSGINYYWIDEDFKVWESRQTIHPYKNHFKYKRYLKDS